MSNNRKAERIHTRLRKAYPGLIVLCYVSDDGEDLVLKATSDEMKYLEVREWLPIELDGNTLFRVAKDRIRRGVDKELARQRRDKEWAESIDAARSA